VKPLLALLALNSALMVAQPARSIPPEMRPLQMLEGNWHTAGGFVEFRFQAANTKMICRVSPDRGAGPSRDAMTIGLENGLVLADFFELKAAVIHYRMVESGVRSVRFEEVGKTGKAARSITYKKEDAGTQISYEFRAGDRVTDRGVLSGAVRFLPLSE